MLQGATRLFSSNLTISSSKKRRGGLSGNEGKEVRRRQLWLVFSGRSVSSQLWFVTARVYINIRLPCPGKQQQKSVLAREYHKGVPKTYRVAKQSTCIV